MSAPGGEIEIRRATPEDAPAISAVLAEAFAEFEERYTKEAYAATVVRPAEARQRMGEGPVWVALLDGAVVATVAAVLEDGGCLVRGMAAVPAARGRGVGRRLLDEIEAFARDEGVERLYLGTTPYLDRAIRLYQGQGFRRAATGPDDFHGTPLFIMEKRVR